MRTLALDALGYDPQRGDPLYKHWPFVLTRACSGHWYGMYYDTLSVCTFDFGCEHDDYHGPRRYVFTWNTAKFPDPKTLSAKFQRHGMRLVANVKPCLLDDHPAYEAVRAQGGFVTDTATGQPVVAQFWDGVGSHIDLPHRLPWPGGKKA